MASKISTDDWPGRRVTFADYARDLACRRAAIEAETGEALTAPRNAGTRRTRSKKALLAEVERLAAAQGFRW